MLIWNFLYWWLFWFIYCKCVYLIIYLARLLNKFLIDIKNLFISIISPLYNPQLLFNKSFKDILQLAFILSRNPVWLLISNFITLMPFMMMMMMIWWSWMLSLDILIVLIQFVILVEPDDGSGVEVISTFLVEDFVEIHLLFLGLAILLFSF